MVGGPVFEEILMEPHGAWKRKRRACIYSENNSKNEYTCT